jgi:uncharacterized protein YndB with AHSA1/START domain
MTENIVSVPPNENYFTITREFEAPRALVYRCYTQPRHLARFWGPRDAKTTSTVDLRVGGVWVTRWRYDDGKEYGYTSVYLELVEPERIHYRDAPNDWPGGLDDLPPAEIISTISLDEQRNRTTVTAHIRCTSVETRDETVARGFSGMVSVGNDRLAEYLETLEAEGDV